MYLTVFSKNLPAILVETFNTVFINSVVCKSDNSHELLSFSEAFEEGEFCLTEMLSIKFIIFSRPVSLSIGFIVNLFMSAEKLFMSQRAALDEN